jgi:hypothetical protein
MEMFNKENKWINHIKPLIRFYINLKIKFNLFEVFQLKSRSIGKNLNSHIKRFLSYITNGITIKCF